MVNRALYKTGFIKTKPLLATAISLLTILWISVVCLYNPESGGPLVRASETMPKFMTLLGMTPTTTELSSYIATFVYGLPMLLLTVFHSMISACRLRPHQFKPNLLLYPAGAPIKRTILAYTQFRVMGTGIFILNVYLTLLGIITCELLYPGDLDIVHFILLNTGTLYLHLFVGGIYFWCFCNFINVRPALGMATGFLMLELFIMIIASNDVTSGMKSYATFFSLYRPHDLMAGNYEALGGLIILFAGSITLYSTAIAIFLKKSPSSTGKS